MDLLLALMSSRLHATSCSGPDWAEILFGQCRRFTSHRRPILDSPELLEAIAQQIATNTSDDSNLNIMVCFELAICFGSSQGKFRWNIGSSLRQSRHL